MKNSNPYKLALERACINRRAEDTRRKNISNQIESIIGVKASTIDKELLFDYEFATHEGYKWEIQHRLIYIFHEWQPAFIVKCDIDQASPIWLDIFINDLKQHLQ